MTLSQIMETIIDHPAAAALAIVLGSLVAVKKVELPVWGWISEWVNRRLDGLGKRLNASVDARLSEVLEAQGKMQTEITELKEGQAAQKTRAERDKADRHREQILQFNLDLVNDRYLDREAFVEALLHIDCYEAYCRDHPEYPNSRADAAIANIRRSYDHKLAHGFHKIKII